MRVMIFDYGAGNLHSLAKAVSLSGAEVMIEPDPVRATEGDVLILPGVGAFGSAAPHLAPGRTQMKEALTRGLPCLGICLGMQLLFDESDEGEGAGLGVFPGRVTRLRSPRTPQIGWNSIDDNRDPDVQASHLKTAYFANAYVCRPASDDVVTAWSEHDGEVFPSIVRKGSVVGVQFHPEKSSAAGLRFIRSFLERGIR